MNTTPATLDEHRARQVLMVMAFEASEEANPAWGADDRAWATRLARETTPASASDAAFVAARAHHALQRLAPRASAITRALVLSPWRLSWCLWAALTGFLIGVVIDQIGASQRINLLASPLWGVVGWNALVYLWLLARLVRLRMSPLVHALSLRRWLQVRWAARPQGLATASYAATIVAFGAAWQRVAAPLNLARAGALVHVAAAALALGVMTGLYLRGLVLDYRAGWQSTFLDAAQVQALLKLLLEPASRVSGIAVPAVAALQVAPDTAATADAAPWIHLFATTLLAFVMLPRALLAAWSLWRARQLSLALPLPWHEAYFERLRLARGGATSLVQVWPHGTEPKAQAALGLQALLAAEFEAPPQLRIEPTTAYGDEDSVPARAPGVLAVALFDLSATPERESQGRFIVQLKKGGAVIVVTDEAAFAERFAATPERLAQRRELWRRFCEERGVRWMSTALQAPA